jgi:hypothetical protein
MLCVPTYRAIVLDDKVKLRRWVFPIMRPKTENVKDLGHLGSNLVAGWPNLSKFNRILTKFGGFWIKLGCEDGNWV